MKRRDFLLTTGAGLGVASLGGLGVASSAINQTESTRYDLTVQNAQHALTDTITKDMVSLSPDAPPPVLTGRQGQPMAVNVTNSLPEYTAMHWHGLRIPNTMDGVPYLTQVPIGESETYPYAFTPPDAGTYWYHPHCMTMGQMARGLTGVLVIEEPLNPGFDADQIVNLRFPAER